jgi:membrane-associated phospholipid phosphatase
MEARRRGVHKDEPAGRSAWRLLPLVLFVAVLAIFADLARQGPLLHLDVWVANIWTFQGPYDYPVADAFDRIGQRLVCLPLLLGVAFFLARRLGTIRPLVLAVGATLFLNFVVGVLKLASGRESPRTGGPELFVGDNVLFPSGHTANVIFVYGLTAALLVRYGQVPTRVRRVLVVAVGLILVLMIVISVYRHTHWFSDLVAGAMIGGAVLQLSLDIDRGWSGLVRLVRKLTGPAWVIVQWGVGVVRRRVMPASPTSAPAAKATALERPATESVGANSEGRPRLEEPGVTDPPDPDREATPSASTSDSAPRMGTRRLPQGRSGETSQREWVAGPHG